jgi:hypothetical protein
MATSKTSESNRSVWIIAMAVIAIVMAMTMAMVAWLTGWLSFGTDPRVQEILALQEQARARYATGGGPSNLAEATAAFTSFTEIRQKTEQLPTHLQPQVEAAAGNAFRTVFWARVDGYFGLPPAQRQAELDRQIDQQEIIRKAFEAGRAVMGALGGGQTTSQPAGRPSWSSRNEDERNRARKSMVDRTTPEERARFTEYTRALDARREKRGLPSSWSR